MLTEIIREAWIALKRNYTRTFLTMLGIVWGIATVTLLTDQRTARRPARREEGIARTG